MKTLGMIKESLKKFNEKNEREDTLCMIEMETYRKSKYTHDWIRTNQDSVVFQSDSFKDTEIEFNERVESLIQSKYGFYDNKRIVLRFMLASEVYEKEVNYIVFRDFDSEVYKEFFNGTFKEVD